MRNPSSTWIGPLIAVGLGLPLLLPNDARACTCFQAEPGNRDQQKRYIDDELKRAVAVFLGEVVAADDLKATLKIDKVWKGKLPGEITIRTGARANVDGTITSNSCDWHYERGQRYLIFAYGSSLEDMKASHCTPTAIDKYAKPTMTLLAEIVGREE